MKIKIKSAKPKVKLAVVGLDDYGNLYDNIFHAINEVRKDYDIVLLIVEDVKKGIGRVVNLYARKEGIPVKVIKLNKEKYGKKAVLIRNTKIVKNANYIIVFYDGISKKYLDLIKKAKKAGKELKVLHVLKNDSIVYI